MEFIIEYFEDNFTLNTDVTELDGLDTISLYVAIAMKSPEKSPFAPYVKALPNTFTTLLENWPESVVQFFTVKAQQT